MIRHCLVTIVLLAACADSGPGPGIVLPADLTRVVMSAMEVGPWLQDPTGWGPACSARATCQAVVVSPFVYRVPRGEWYVFAHPDRLLGRLDVTSFTSLADGTPIPVRTLRNNECARDFEHRPIVVPKVACVLLGVNEASLSMDGELSDTVMVHMVVESPSNGQMWPFIKAHRTPNGWHALLVRNYGE